MDRRDGDGVYDVLEIETAVPSKARAPMTLRPSPRLRRRIELQGGVFLDKSNPNIPRRDHVYDHALTRP